MENSTRPAIAKKRIRRSYRIRADHDEMIERLSDQLKINKTDLVDEAFILLSEKYLKEQKS